MKIKLKKLMFMMSLYMFLLVGCGSKKDNKGELNDLLNAVTRLELEIESLKDEQNNLIEQFSMQ